VVRGHYYSICTPRVRPGAVTPCYKVLPAREEEWTGGAHTASVEKQNGSKKMTNTGNLSTIEQLGEVLLAVLVLILPFAAVLSVG